ncbi:MAG: hypothetical protein ACLQU3_19050 [Limisphaerales bacterium]
MSKDSPKIPSIWHGYLSGSNRGRIVVRLQQTLQGLEAQTVFVDYQFGPVIVPLRGKLEQKAAKFRLMGFEGFAPLLPLDGELLLTFDDDFENAAGTWSTDIGTGGTCKLERSNETVIRWLSRLFGIRLGWFWFRWRAKVYSALLLCVAAAALTQLAHLTTLALVLLLLPAPFIFAKNLSRLVGLFHDARIKKIGPVEFDQNPPTAEIVAIATQQAQESIAFAQLNQFFVLRTKILLAVLAHSNGMLLADFAQLARSFGVLPENVQTTLIAILQMGCAQVVDGKVIPTEWGRRFVQKGLRLA